MTEKKEFAAVLAELEQVVGELDSDIPIERALALFEQGMKLSAECEKFLAAAEQRIEMIKRSADGNLVLERYEGEALDIPEPGAIS